MIHVVIDTNVLVSVLMAKSEHSTVIKVINAVRDGRLTPLYNDEIIEEYKEVLSRPKFRFGSDVRNALIDCIRNKGLDAERVHFDEYMPDESDRVFYEIALSKDDAYLITGNAKHFPHTRIVVTPAEMLKILD